MIIFEVEKGAIEKISKNLSEVWMKSPQALKNAVNQTARQARKLLADKAKDAYTVKAGRFNKAMTIKNATTRNPTAIIIAKGSPMELKDFRVSPNKPGYNPKGTTRAKVYSSSVLKALEIRGIKAFVVQFRSGHVSVAQRVGQDRLPIKTLYSTSIPKMIGNEKEVYGVIEPKIQEILDRCVQVQVEKIISRMR
jgi:hypothetical protein